MCVTFWCMGNVCHKFVYAWTMYVMFWCKENVCHVFGCARRMYVMHLGMHGECMSCVWVCMENVCHVYGCTWRMYVMCLGVHGECMSCVWVCMENVCHASGCAWRMSCVWICMDNVSCVWARMENGCHVSGCAWRLCVSVSIADYRVCFCIYSRLHRLLNPWWFVWLACSLSLASHWRAPLAAYTPSSSCLLPPPPPPSSPSTRAPRGRATKMVSVNALPLAVRFLSAVFNFRIVEWVLTVHAQSSMR